MLEDRALDKISRRDLARIIAYLPQESSFTFDYTVRDVVLMGRFPYMNGVWAYTKKDYQIIREMMLLMEIDGFADRSF